MIDRGVPREGYEVFKGDVKVGYVSSGTFSPTLGKGIALCFVNLEERVEGNEVSVKVRDRSLRAVLRSVKEKGYLSKDRVEETLRVLEEYRKDIARKESLPF